VAAVIGVWAGCAAPALASVPSGSQTFGFNDSQQFFTVPAGVTNVQITGSGGSGGQGQRVSGANEYDALGGLGAEMSLPAQVTPGDTLLIEVGGAGGAAPSSTTGGAGGESSGDGENGAAGGNINSGTGAAGGGGGGGTEVIDTTTNTMILDAGGGGGGGGGGVDTGANGGEGGDAGDTADGGGAPYGNGHYGEGGVPGLPGQVAATGIPAGTGSSTVADASGPGAGGGGAGGYQPAGGGGTGGAPGAAGGGGSGGGAGASHALGAFHLVVGAGPYGNGAVTVAWGTPQTAAGAQSAFFGFNDTQQSFTVPAGVHQLTLAASGGTGGFGHYGLSFGTQEFSRGGYGALIDLVAAVNPGDNLLLETGGLGANAGSQAGGAGGEASGDGQYGGGGGTINSLADGGGGGGGGGGTEVIDTTTNTVILDAGGGGGGGGGGGSAGTGAFSADGGHGGDAGSAFASPANAATFGDGFTGAVLGGGAGGLFAADGIPPGYGGSGEQPGSGGGAGGGGGGGYQPAGGGGTGGSAGSDGGGGGGGGAGASYVEPGASDVTLSNGRTTDGYVEIFWAPPPASTTTLSVSAASVKAGAPVTFTATVAGPAAAGSAPSGTVVFDLDGTQVGTGTLNGKTPDQATFTSSSLPVGVHQVIASYGGDATYTPSASSQSPLTVIGASSTTLASSANPVLEGRQVTLTATVAGVPAGGPAVPGSVAFAPAVCGVPIPCATATLNSASPDQASYTATVANVTPGAYKITATTTSSSAEYTASSTTFTLNVAGILVSTSVLPQARVGSVYSSTLAAAGGVTPYHWSIASGSLPAGLALNASTGTISGTPTTAQSASFTVKVTDSSTPTALSATQALTLSVNPFVTPEVWVVNGANSAVHGFALGATGNTTPLSTIAGSATGLNGTSGVALDSSGRVYIASSNNGSIVEYPYSANGNQAPATTISGASTGLSDPAAVALDSSGRLYVANQAADQITEYAAGASGNAAPVATISGQATGLSSPDALTVDGNGHLWVADYANNTLTEYAAGATGNAAPVATVSSGLDGPTAMTIAPSGDILVANQFGESITGYPLNASASTNPVITISGTSTGLAFPRGVDVDTNGNIYVSNQGDSAIEEFAANANANATPLATITGSATGLAAPGQLAVAPPMSILTTRLPRATRHARYHATIKVALGTTPYHWKIAKGHLPPGLRLHSATGAITGTPRKTGTYKFLVKVTDSTHPRMTATQPLSITVTRATKPTGGHGGSSRSTAHIKAALAGVIAPSGSSRRSPRS
jgi:hypothetical protein